MARLFKIQYILFMIILLLCACGNKSKVSTTNSNNESFKKDESSTDSEYILEKREESDGFIWYSFHVKGKKKGDFLMKGAMNENKEIVIEPFWGFVEYQPRDKRFRKYEFLLDNYNQDEYNSIRDYRCGLYDKDGSCIIPESRCYKVICPEEISHSLLFWYTVYYNDEKGGGLNGVCDSYGTELIKPGGHGEVRYEKVDEKIMFVIHDKDNNEDIYTHIYINEKGKGVKYISEPTDDYTTSSSFNSDYSNDNYYYNKNINETRQPSRFPCRACHKSPGICGSCDGTRQVKQHYDSSTGSWIMRPCNACSGTGICHACKGDGWIDEGVDF